MERQELVIKIKQQINQSQLAKSLSDLGYENVGVSTPSKVGQFGGRGNLIDIWLERYRLPVRIDLIGDTVENIYLVNYLTQTKIRIFREVYIIPCGLVPKLASKWLKPQKFPAKFGRVERLFLSEIAPGDLVVHIDHGIGRFLGVASRRDLSTPAFQTRLPALRETPRSFEGPGEQAEKHVGAGLAQTDEKSGVIQISPESKLAEAKRFLVVEYAEGDKLYVPVEQIDRLTKYIGAAGYKARLNRLGTGGWERVKARVQESIVKVARDLLQLYAKRQIVTRAPYSRDTPWQGELEDSFEFPETQGQVKAVEEIKKDLEGPRPMDRLLVGDVGFGKTEVAVRAAFKIVQDGKQVALLVPTTILVEQHYHLFKERLAPFPVEIAVLSRFKTKEEQEAIINKLQTGQTDIVIGTHRLLSGDVKFKSLGLLVIDEEHRFGVRHKEKLKAARPVVDVLSMSATPIPRTLQMALSGLRDVSVLSEPPAARLPIETFIGEHDDKKIKEAIWAEIARGGQVYYVFNQVAALAKKAGEVAARVPKAQIVYAHGQMEGPQLEQAMQEFYSGRADVLVCTTIIGSGLDMPNVNTIIIENVQRFGLAELHQLCGRVGRSNRQAYAFLFYPKGYVPVGETLERLLTFASARELGAGFTLAKKDLEIRGAGNLLGVAQHGNIALVGFDLYIQLLSQVIERLK